MIRTVLELRDALLDAAHENTERAQAAGAEEPGSVAEASLAARNYAQTALAQIQAAMTLTKPGR